LKKETCVISQTMKQKPNNLLQISTITILAGTAVSVNSSRLCNIASRTKVNPIKFFLLWKQFTHILPLRTTHILADDLASKKSALTSSMSSFLILVLSLTFAAKAAGVKSCTTYLRVVFVPSSPRLDRASSSICSPSVTALSFTICSISCLEYGRVLIIRRRSNRSRGMPCGEIMSSVPLISQRPRFVAKITIGAIALSNARCR
ncbi:hypothetical protein ALC57_15670, partial [Trachymyrmex cornetzi]